MTKKVKLDIKYFGTMVSGRRKWDEFSLRDAADEVGVSPATLSRVENGKMPDLVSYKLICDWLHMDMNYFFSTSKKQI